MSATLLDRAVHAAHVARVPSAKKNPAAMLGAVIGALALQGPRQAHADHAARRSTRSASGSSSSSPSRPARKARASCRSPASRCSIRDDYGNDRALRLRPHARLGHDVARCKALAGRRPSGRRSSCSKTRSTSARSSSPGSSPPPSPARSSASTRSISRTCRSRRTTRSGCSRSSSRRGTMHTRRARRSKPDDAGAIGALLAQRRSRATTWR